MSKRTGKGTETGTATAKISGKGSRLVLGRGQTSSGPMAYAKIDPPAVDFSSLVAAGGRQRSAKIGDPIRSEVYETELEIYLYLYRLLITRHHQWPGRRPSSQDLALRRLLLPARISIPSRQNSWVAADWQRVQQTPRSLALTEPGQHPIEGKGHEPAANAACQHSEVF